MQYLAETYLPLLRAFLMRLECRLRLKIDRLRLQRKGRFSQSSLVSLMMRPWLERERIRLWVGAPLAAMAMAGGLTQLPLSEQALATWSIEEPVTQLIDSSLELPVVTKESYMALPVEQLYGISQFYHAGHPGLDMRGPLNGRVLCIEDGWVERVIYSPTGYGNHIYVAHKKQVVSLYAHLGKIWVQEGQGVDKGQALGNIGMTGFSTGPHLHFELYTEGGRANPIYYLSDAIGEYQKQLAAGN